MKTRMKYQIRMDDEPYVPSTDSEEESEDDDYESTEDEVVTPSISMRKMMK